MCAVLARTSAATPRRLPRGVLCVRRAAPARGVLLRGVLLPGDCARCRPALRALCPAACCRRRLGIASGLCKRSTCNPREPFECAAVIHTLLIAEQRIFFACDERRAGRVSETHHPADVPVPQRDAIPRRQLGQLLRLFLLGQPPALLQLSRSIESR